jgi:hypothetical protein
VGYIAEILTCLADQLVPVPPSISRAQEARGSLTGGPSLLRHSTNSSANVYGLSPSFSELRSPVEVEVPAASD